jgi:hypothetical protein
MKDAETIVIMNRLADEYEGAQNFQGCQIRTGAKI